MKTPRNTGLLPDCGTTLHFKDKDNTKPFKSHVFHIFGKDTTRMSQDSSAGIVTRLQAGHSVVLSHSYCPHAYDLPTYARPRTVWLCRCRHWTPSRALWKPQTSGCKRYSPWTREFLQYICPLITQLRRPYVATVFHCRPCLRVFR
jgi:hypothetical protein